MHSITKKEEPLITYTLSDVTVHREDACFKFVLEKDFAYPQLPLNL